MENTSTHTTAGSTPAKKGWFARNRIWFIVIALFAITNSGIYFYQRFQQQKQADKYSEIMVEKGQLARDLVSMKNLEAVQILMKTLVWGVRGEMVRGNKEFIDLFLINLVQETQVDLVIIEDTNRVIYLSTDKKYENQTVGQILTAVPDEINAPKILTADVGEVTAAAPIMGLESHLGTLYLVYKVDGATEKLMDDIGEDPFATEDKPALKEGE